MFFPYRGWYKHSSRGENTNSHGFSSSHIRAWLALRMWVFCTHSCCYPNLFCVVFSLYQHAEDHLLWVVKQKNWIFKKKEKKWQSQPTHYHKSCKLKKMSNYRKLLGVPQIKLSIKLKTFFPDQYEILSDFLRIHLHIKASFSLLGH